MQDVSDEKKRPCPKWKKPLISRIVSTTVNYVEGEGKTLFTNSDGTQLEMEDSRVALFMNTVAPLMVSYSSDIKAQVVPLVSRL